MTSEAVRIAVHLNRLRSRSSDYVKRFQARVFDRRLRRRANGWPD